MLDELIDGPLRVLIAEDETIIRMDLRGLLEKNGMMVVGEAANGAPGGRARTHRDARYRDPRPANARARRRRGRAPHLCRAPHADREC